MHHPSPGTCFNVHVWKVKTSFEAKFQTINHVSSFTWLSLQLYDLKKAWLIKTSNYQPLASLCLLVAVIASFVPACAFLTSSACASQLWPADCCPPPPLLTRRCLGHRATQQLGSENQILITLSPWGWSQQCYCWSMEILLVRASNEHGVNTQ